MNNKLLLVLALSGAIVPLVIGGCGGGGGGLLNPQTPQTPASVNLTPTTFTLQNGQRVTLTGTRTGDKLAGKLAVAGAAAQPKLTSGAQNQAFPFSVTNGEYGYTGTFTPPRGFSIVGNFGSLGSFQMSGQLQTATQDGSYSLTTNGVTDTGILPASGGTPTATATPAPSTGNYKLTGDLMISDATAGSSVIKSPLNTFVYTPNAGELGNTSVNTQTLGFGGTDSNPSGNGTNSFTTRSISVGLASAFSGTTVAQVPFSKDQKFTLGQNFVNLVQYNQTSVNGTAIKFTIWRAKSGDVFVRDIGTDSAKVELVNLKMQGLTTMGTVDTAAGEFTLNGTLTATGLTVKTN